MPGKRIGIKTRTPELLNGLATTIQALDELVKLDSCFTISDSIDLSNTNSGSTCQENE